MQRKRVTIVHSDLPGEEVQVPESALPFHRAAGWVLAEEVADEPTFDRDGQAEAPESDTKSTAKGRRVSKKDGD